MNNLKVLLDVILHKKIDGTILRDRLPLDLAHNQTFLIDINAIPFADITTDGIIYEKRAIVPTTMNVWYDEDAKKATITFDDYGNITAKRRYGTCFSTKLDGAWLKRTITTFERSDTGRIYPLVAISYKTSPISEGRTELFRRPHGNAKKKAEIYVKTFPSVMEKLKDIAKGNVLFQLTLHSNF